MLCETIQEKIELMQIEMKRCHILAKQHDCDVKAKELQQAAEKKKKEDEILRQREMDFADEEEKIIRRENNDLVKTKRLIDNMMHRGNNSDIFELLSNYKGISFH